MRPPVDGLVRGAGLSVFVIGVMLLVTVFFLAYQELLASGVMASPPMATLSVILLVLAKGLFLLVMGYAASAISNKGIGLYQVATHPEREV